MSPVFSRPKNQRSGKARINESILIRAFDFDSSCHGFSELANQLTVKDDKKIGLSSKLIFGAKNFQILTLACIAVKVDQGRDECSGSFAEMQRFEIVEFGQFRKLDQNFEKFEPCLS